MSQQAVGTSLDHLDTMLRSGKISEDDYNTLRGAVEGSTLRPTAAGPGSGTSPRAASGKPRLQKSFRHRQLGGVCYGLGQYTGIHPYALRVAFVVGTFFSGAALLLYLILYFVMPWSDEAEEAPPKFPMAYAFAVAAYAALLNVVYQRLISQVGEMYNQLGGTMPALLRIIHPAMKTIFGTPAGWALQGFTLIALIAGYVVGPRSARGRRIYAVTTTVVLVLAILVLFLSYYSGMFVVIPRLAGRD